MNEGIPFRSRHVLQWQVVLVNPLLLRAVQRRLGSSGPSHAIEQALRQALRFDRQSPPRARADVPVH